MSESKPGYTVLEKPTDEPVVLRPPVGSELKHDLTWPSYRRSRRRSVFLYCAILILSTFLVAGLLLLLLVFGVGPFCRRGEHRALTRFYNPRLGGIEQHVVATDKSIHSMLKHLPYHPVLNISHFPNDGLTMIRTKLHCYFLPIADELRYKSPQEIYKQSVSNDLSDNNINTSLGNNGVTDEYDGKENAVDKPDSIETSVNIQVWVIEPHPNNPSYERIQAVHCHNSNPTLLTSRPDLTLDESVDFDPFEDVQMPNLLNFPFPKFFSRTDDDDDGGVPPLLRLARHANHLLKRNRRAGSKAVAPCKHCKIRDVVFGTAILKDPVHASINELVIATEAP